MVMEGIAGKRGWGGDDINIILMYKTLKNQRKQRELYGYSEMTYLEIGCKDYFLEAGFFSFALLLLRWGGLSYCGSFQSLKHSPSTPNLYFNGLQLERSRSH